LYLLFIIGIDANKVLRQNKWKK